MQENTIIFLLEASYRPWVIGAVFLTWVGLIGTMYRSPISRKWFRGIMLSIALFCLLLAGLRPAQMKREAARKVIYLTENYPVEIVDSLTQLFPKAALFSSTNALDLPYQVTQIPDVSTILNSIPQLEELHILGDGLKEDEFEPLQERKVFFHLNALPEGVIQIGYPQITQLGNALIFKGSINKNNTEKWTVSIEGTGTVLASTTIDKAGEIPFELKFTPKSAGRFLYSLKIKNDQDTIIQADQIPVVVTPLADYRILIVQATPSFETKYLKNLLAKDGRTVAVRSRVSKGKFKTDFINSEEIDLAKINSSVLKNFELLVMDQAAIGFLAAEERQTLKKAIQNGLGFLLLADASTLKSDNQFLTKQISLKKTLSKSTTWPFVTEGGVENISLSTLPYSIMNNQGFYPVIEASGNIYAAYKRQDAGRVLVSLLDKTYLLQLNSQSEAYRSLWMTLLNACLAPEWFANDWILEEPLLAYVRHPFTIKLITEEQSPSIFLSFEERNIGHLPAFQHPTYQEEWESVIWSTNTGWHSVATKRHPQERKWVFIQDKTAWKSLSRAKRIQANKRWFSKHQPAVYQPPLLAVNQQKAFPLWWFYLGFLMALGLLWVEEKW